MKKNNLLDVKPYHELNNHIKSQLLFYSLEDNRISSVHFQKLSKPINRLIQNYYHQFSKQRLLPEEEHTMAQQMVSLLSFLGEIGKLDKGYYIPLPMRCVQLPKSKDHILLSSSIDMNDNYIGCCSGYTDGYNDIPKMQLLEWMPSISVEEFLQIIRCSPSVIIEDEPTKCFVARNHRKWIKLQNVEKGEPFIAKYEFQHGPSQYYWVEKGIRGKKIAFSIEYLSLAKLALDYRGNIKRYAQVTNIDSHFVELKFNQRIPRTEQMMLMLFAFPNHFFNPTNWIIPRRHLKDTEAILERIKMRINYE